MEQRRKLTLGIGGGCSRILAEARIEQLGKWLRRDATRWTCVHEKLFGGPGFNNSLRSQSTRGLREDLDDELSQQEWSCETKALVLLIVFAVVCR